KCLGCGRDELDRVPAFELKGWIVFRGRSDMGGIEINAEISIGLQRRAKRARTASKVQHRLTAFWFDDLVNQACSGRLTAKDILNGLVDDRHLREPIYALGDLSHSFLTRPHFRPIVSHDRWNHAILWKAGHLQALFLLGPD